jgi:hypothetical protein
LFVVSHIQQLTSCLFIKNAHFLHLRACAGNKNAIFFILTANIIYETVLCVFVPAMLIPVSGAEIIFRKLSTPAKRYVDNFFDFL